MNSFYKGGSELPTGKGSSCSKQIKSKKLWPLAFKLVVLFRLYFTSISPVRIKHSLSTDIVLFTQLLRKHIYKGKTCYQSAFLLLYTYLIIGSKLTSKKLSQKLTKPRLSSAGLRRLFDISSNLLRDCVASSSGLLRLLFDCPSGASRSSLEAEPKPSRSVAEHVSNESRRGPEALPKPSQRGEAVAILIRLRLYFTYICQALAGHANRLSCKGAGRLPKKEAVPSSDFLLTNTLPTPYFILSSHWFCITFPLALFGSDPRKTHVSPEQHSKSGRSWSGIGRYLIGLFPATKGTIDSRLSYRECTESVPKRYWKGTKELLQRYREATNKIQAFSSFLLNFRYKLGGASEMPAKMHSSDLVSGGDGCRLKSEGLQTFCDTRLCKDEYLAVQKKTSAQKALEYFSVVAGYGKGYRMSLTCLLLMIVSMFSLSAQTPRKNSGADGLSSLVALKPGDKIPDAVWNQRLELNYFNGKKKTIKFSDLKGKLILLDFWATWCPSCIEGFSHLEEVAAINKDEIAVLLVNSAQTKDTQKRVRDLKKKYNMRYGFQTSLPYLFGDSIFQQLFPHNAIPHVVWINKKGILVANTYPNVLTKENVTAVLHTGNADFHQKKLRTNREVALITNEMLNKGFYAGSVFQTYQEGLDASSGNYSFDGKRTKYQLLNLRFSQLLAIAFQKELKGIPWRHWQFDATKAPDSKQKLLASNRYDNRFCYEMVYMDSLSKVGAKKWFTEDFKRFFGIELSVENKSTDVLQIAFNSAFEKIRSKGGVPEVFLGDSRTEMKFRNIPLELLIDNLSLYFHRPLVIGASKDMPIDMIIPKDFEDWGEDTRKEFLRAMGLELNPAKKTITCATFFINR